MQDHPGAPGSTPEGDPRTVVPAARGGAAAHHMAPGHDSVPAAPSSAASHDRPRAAHRVPDHHRSRAAQPRAPVPDQPHATPPQASGHDRPRAAQWAPGHDRPCATPRAPGPDVPLVTLARAPGHGRLRAAHRAPPGRALASAGTSMPIATAPLPACVGRLLQVCLPRVAATPHTLTYPPSRSAPAPGHPAILVPTRPQPCSTAGTGFLPPHPRAHPPAARRKPTLVRGVRRGARPC